MYFTDLCINTTVEANSNDVEITASSSGYVFEPRQALKGSDNAFVASDLSDSETLTVFIQAEDVPKISKISFATVATESSTIKILTNEGLLPVYQEVGCNTIIFFVNFDWLID